MNEKEKKHYEMYFPMYYSSFGNNHNSSAAEGTSRLEVHTNLV